MGTQADGTGSGATQTGSTDQLVVGDSGTFGVVHEPPTSTGNGSATDVCYRRKHANTITHQPPYTPPYAALDCRRPPEGVTPEGVTVLDSAE